MAPYSVVFGMDSLARKVEELDIRLEVSGLENQLLYVESEVSPAVVEVPKTQLVEVEDLTSVALCLRIGMDFVLVEQLID